MEYSIQMYGLRDITPKDMEGALRAVSEAGYKYVEFAGFFGHSAKEIRAMLDKFGLEVSGTHTGANEIADDFGARLRYHREIGNQNIIIPGFDYSTSEKLDGFVDFVNEYQPRLAAEGIKLLYHNHSGEFATTGYGVKVFDELEKRTNITFEIDTYWAYHAGVEPTALLEKLGERVPVIHIKDGTESGEGRTLGKGSAPVRAVHDYAEKHGILMCVESETLTPDGISEAKQCMEYLRRL